MRKLVKCPLCGFKVRDRGLEFLECPFCHCTFQRPVKVDISKKGKKQ